MKWINGVLQIWSEDDLHWPDELRPRDYGKINSEPLEAWYDRSRVHVGHLHPLIAGQWVHRHWHNSPYCCFPLEGLRWREECWPSRRVLAVYIPDFEFRPEHDYAALHSFPGNPTAEPMDRTGTWDIPVPVLETPAGVIDRNGIQPDVRHLLIEGHQRLRYLNALVYRGEASPEHQVFVLSYGPEKILEK